MTRQICDLPVYPQAFSDPVFPIMVNDSTFLPGWLQPSSLPSRAEWQNNQGTAFDLCVALLFPRPLQRTLKTLNQRGRRLVLQNPLCLKTFKKRKKGTQWGSQKGILCCNGCLPCPTGCWGGSGCYNPRGKCLLETGKWNSYYFPLAAFKKLATLETLT